MTEIKIEKKKPIWPWILLTLGILAAVYFIATNNNKEKAEAREKPDTSMLDVHENNSAVAAYVIFTSSEKNKMTLDHSYINKALLKLIDATNAIAVEVDYNVKADLDKAKELANKITNDPFETSHADNIRKATDIIAGVLQNMQRAKYPSLEIEVREVTLASESINPETLTLDQKDVVSTYFAKAATLLEKMN